MATENQVMPNHHRHTIDEVNNIDPDEGNSSLCNACKLPIFASPFVCGLDDGALLHDQCANLPKELMDCDLHPRRKLLLGDNNDHQTCSECSQECGSKVYKCGHPSECCGLILDVACALPVKILHRSHRHKLLAVRGFPDSSSCGVCGVAHQAAAGWSYYCRVCGFWIHPDCAALPTAIQHEKHEHPLVLYYHVDAARGAQYSTSLGSYRFKAPPSSDDQTHNFCAICQQEVGSSFGIYSCLDCRDCIIHINCATATATAKSNPPSFKAVSCREAQFPGLVRLPLADEHESIVGYLGEAQRRSNSITTATSYPQSIESMHQYWGRNEHSFMLHHEMKSDEDYVVCDVCIKAIKAPPFYSCSSCPNLFLHDYCYCLPIFLSGNPAHECSHAFVFDVDDDSFTTSIDPICSHCSCRYIQARYKCTRQCYFDLDVWCALMPGHITHDAHSAAHFLRFIDSSKLSRDCNCCGRSLGKLAYECRTCPNFALHTWCAMLPGTVTHKFDPHPLLLITTTNSNNNEMICEICENWMDDKVWYYMCKECDQSFHINCIPVLDLAYKIKSLASVGKLRNSDIPTRLIRGLTLQGHAQDYCSDVADEYDILASDED